MVYTIYQAYVTIDNTLSEQLIAAVDDIFICSLKRLIIVLLLWRWIFIISFIWEETDQQYRVVVQCVINSEEW